MVRTNEFIAFPSGLFFRMIVPLYFIEFDGLLPCDMVFLIQYLDRCSRYDISASSGVTSRRTTSEGAFRHFLSYKTWNMS
jgi:hypothetical protein